MLTVLAWDRMKRLTIDIPDELHEAFFLKCVTAKPRMTMKQRMIEFIAKDTGKPVPKVADGRKRGKSK